MRWLLLLFVACRAPSQPERDEYLGLHVPAQWGITLKVHESRMLDVRSALAELWLAREPAMLVVAADIDEPPPEGGWDAQATVKYAMPATGARGVRVEWRRLGARSYTILVDGDPKALGPREAQIETLIGSLKPPGLRPETLAGPVRAIDSQRLDRFVARAFGELAVPGAAIGVLVDGRVVYERVLGIRSIEGPERITRDTRFLMASISKPMTTLMEAALVDDKKLAWDSPVTTLLPTFALGDAEITKQLVLWQMSCACTGMPRQDMEGLFEWNEVTPEARIAVMRTMKPTTKLGETFQYSNPMVAAGGYAAAHAAYPELPLDRAFATAIEQKVFAPIKMTATVDFAVVKAGEHALPHALAIDGSTHLMPLEIERAVLPIAPAGAVWASLADMERYALTELAEGVSPDGKRVVSLENYRARTKQRVASDATSGYGLGIDVGTYHGLRVLAHDGGSFGFGTRMYLLPDVNVAIVILTNVRNGSAKEQLPFNTAVTRAILEELFAQAQPLADKQLAYYVKLRTHEPYVASTDRTWVAKLAGRYHEPVLGDCEIRDSVRGPVFDAGEWSTAIDRIVDPDGSAKLVLLDPPFAGGALLVGAGDPPTLIVPDQTTYTFTRVR